MNSYKTGEIVLINLGSVENKEVLGHEQGKTRPCVVVKSLPELALLIIVPITKTKTSNIHFSKVQINKSDTPLSEDSFALCHQIRTVSVKRAIKSLGDLPENYLDTIQYVLFDLLELT